MHTRALRILEIKQQHRKHTQLAYSLPSVDHAFQQVYHVMEKSKCLRIILEIGATVKNYHQPSQKAFKLTISTVRS